jgi:hypothetical protein
MCRYTLTVRPGATVADMQRDSSTPWKRIFATPRGMAGLDIAGTARQAFVTVTVFDDEGWAAEEDMWWSGHGEDLAEFLARLTGMSPSEADALVGDFMSTWERGGGPEEGAAMTHRFGYGVVGALLAVAGLSGFVTWAFGRRAAAAMCCSPL